MSQLINRAKEFVSSEKKNIIIGIVLLVVGIILWDLYGKSNNAGGTESIRSELDQVKQHQQDTLKRLDTIQTGIDSSANRVGRVSERIITNTDRIVEVERRIETSQAGLEESDRIIKSSQSIIDQVRKRSEK